MLCARIYYYKKNIPLGFIEAKDIGENLDKIEKVEKYITAYPVSGNNEVIKPQYANGKVMINESQYFDKVPQVAWEFYIGGYQPAQKWLKDRKGRILEFDDILHYQKMIVALTETDKLMKGIDKVIEL